MKRTRVRMFSMDAVITSHKQNGPPKLSLPFFASIDYRRLLSPVNSKIGHLFWVIVTCLPFVVFVSQMFRFDRCVDTTLMQGSSARAP